MYKIEDLIESANSVHCCKYTYDISTYTKKTDKMRIICPIHGEFWQSLQQHINKGQGCPKCAKSVSKEHKTRSGKIDKDSYLELATKRFGTKYKYDLSKYKNLSSIISIECPEHGVFNQNANSHLNSKNGCPKCAFKGLSENNMSCTNDFIEKSRKIHGNKYDYSKTKYVDVKTKVCIICPEHGEFWQLPYNHLSGNGCSECGKQRTNNSNRLTNKEFIKRANKIHNNKYEYNDEYLSYKEKINIICPIHGEFQQTPDDHLQGKGCPRCGKTISKAEEEIYNFCCEQIGEENVQQRNRLIIHPYELDIYLRSLGYAIEYNGLRWHSEKFGKDRYYHLNKLNACKEKGIKLIQIFEDEYVNNRDIVYNKLKHIMKLDQNLPRIPGRKCVIKEITAVKAKEFLNKYHIQGYIGSKVYLGAFYNEELVAVMTFKTLDKCNNWELTRFASNYNYICQGVGGKLFTHFIKNYNPEEIKSFADRRWTINEENNIYIKLGFKFDSYTNPDYHYYREEDGPIRQHKFAFRKNRLNKKYGLPLSMTEEKMTENLGYTRIYDCGLIKYTWNKKREA